MSTSLTTPAGELGAKVDPIVFTSSRPVVAISAQFNPDAGNGPRECIFDGTDAANAGGSFAYLYRSSSHVGSTWTIIRENGWPAPFELRIKEA